MTLVLSRVYGVNYKTVHCSLVGLRRRACSPYRDVAGLPYLPLLAFLMACTTAGRYLIHELVPLLLRGGERGTHTLRLARAFLCLQTAILSSSSGACNATQR